MPFKLRDVDIHSSRGTVLANSAHGKTLDNVSVSPDCEQNRAKKEEF